MSRRCLSLVPIVLLLLLAGCTRGEPVSVTRLAPMTPTPLPVEPEPAPTAVAPLSSWNARLVVGPEDGAPLHGAPPYTAQLTANYYPQPGGLPAPCERLVWLFGDGQEEETSCVIDAAAAPHDWQKDHQYNAPGIYHARVQMHLADGTVVESEKTQTVLVAEPQGPGLQEVMLRWVGWATVLVMLGLVLIWVLLQRGARRRWGLGLLVLFLITFVPPFSYVPDPLGIVLSVTGGYTDDLRVPLANRFLIAGDPRQALRPTLNALIGHTGLDPLDAQSPLARYEFVSVRREPHHTAVRVRFIYEDGAQRTYPVPLRHPSSVLGFYACCWRFDGLGRLRSEHQALPPAPFDRGQVVQQPQRLALPSVGAEEAQVWFGAAANPQTPRLAWSPQGDAFLTTVTEHTATALWLLAPQGGEARVLADNVWEYAWAPQGAPVGGAIVYSTVQHDVTIPGEGPLRQIMLVEAEGGAAQRLLSLPVGQSAFPGLTAQGLWFIQDGVLWRQPWQGGAPRRLAEAPDSNAAGARPWPVQARPAPDGKRVAYTCGAALCLMDVDGRNHLRAATDERPVSLAWRDDGRQLAAVFWDYPGGDGRALRLLVLDRDGALISDLEVAPGGLAGAPQWLPGGEALLLPVFPQDGRRMILAEPQSGAVTDLSQPRWDAFFALHPDGDRVVLSNGRGGFWMASLHHVPGASEVPGT